MRYEKPVVIDLSLRARTASGEPEGCYSGGTPTVPATCQAGTGPSGAEHTCLLGPAPGSVFPEMCLPGLEAGSGCMSGYAGSPISDTCTSGPQPG